MTIKAKLISTIALVFCATSLNAQEAVKGAFVNAPFDIVPTLSKDMRLDMIDYFEHGSDRPSKSYFGEDVRVTALDENTLTAQISPSVALTFGLLADKADSLYVVIETVETPAKDSRVSVYSTRWQKLYSFDAGSIADWLNEAGKKQKMLPDVENTLNFITAEATFNPSDKTVTFSNTSSDRIIGNEYATVAPYVMAQRSFSLSSKGAKQLKP